MTGDEMRAEQALAEASAQLAIDLVRSALFMYDSGRLPVATLLATISQADMYGLQSMMTGWDFLEAVRGAW